ncbi:MAG TPA: HNH endonuclease signature motif containing protein [Tepidisphaeraceae bacterium]|jgi:hypothetical protein
MGPFSQQFLDRFWSKVDQSGECWMWLGATRGKPNRRYGVFTFRGEDMAAHRIAFAIAQTSPPDHLVVCHRCDNPLCVRPDHLFLGTVADNNHDRDRKGRQRTLRGSANGRSVLFEDQVVSMRERFAGGMITQTQLAKEFGVARSLVGMIVRGEVWQHAPGPRTERRMPRSNSGYRGVSYMSDSGSYQIYITFQGKRYALGETRDPVTGARRYDAKARELYGDAAAPHLNFPDE